MAILSLHHGHALHIWPDNLEKGGKPVVDPSQLATGLIAGATVVAQIAGTEVVKEVTKDAYRALKGRW
jgi:hypothetical protein